MWPEVTHGLSRAQSTQARSSPSGLSPCHPLFLELSLEKSPLLLLVLVRGSERSANCWDSVLFGVEPLSLLVVGRDGPQAQERASQVHWGRKGESSAQTRSMWRQDLCPGAVTLCLEGTPCGGSPALRPDN